MMEIKGKNVEIFITNNAGKTYIETGTITKILTGIGDNGCFIELDGRVLINVRYILKMSLKD